MKKKVLSVILAGVMAAAMAGCGNGDSQATSGKSTSASSGSSADSTSAAGTGVEDGVFTVGFDAEYPPYGYMDENGEYTGFDLELAQAVCDLEGWELEKKPINWDSKDMELNSGSIDCIWNGFTMNGREDDYTFYRASGRGTGCIGN